MGLALFADTKEDFPITKSLEECRKKIVSKPFSRDFDEQMDAANELYGTQLMFRVKKNDMVKIACEYQDIYGKEVVERVVEILRYQADKYGYMIK